MEAMQQQLKNLAIEQLMKIPVGEKLQQALEIFNTAQEHVYALADKKDELGLTGVKAATVLIFGILKKIGEKSNDKEIAKVGEFTNEDWKEIAASVSQCAIIMDDERYSVFVFSMYERYIRNSAEMIKGIIPDEIYESLIALAAELNEKTIAIGSGEITEITYIEDCMWISLEAMIKLIASCFSTSKDSPLGDFAQAMASFGFEYGRMLLYKREQEIVTQFIEAQYELDTALEEKYARFLEDLQHQSDQFNLLVENAFVPDFRNAFLNSIRFAQESGVAKENILSTQADIDDFFTS